MERLFRKIFGARIVLDVLQDVIESHSLTTTSKHILINVESGGSPGPIFEEIFYRIFANSFENLRKSRKFAKIPWPRQTHFVPADLLVF